MKFCSVGSCPYCLVMLPKVDYVLITSLFVYIVGFNEICNDANIKFNLGDDGYIIPPIMRL